MNYIVKSKTHMVVPGAGSNKSLGKIHKELASTSTGNNYNEGPITTGSPLGQISDASLNTQNNSFITIGAEPNKMSDFDNYDHNLSGTSYNPNNQGGTGGCFAKGQKVETKTRGIVNIEHLEIGDFVKTQKGWSKLYCWNMYTKNTSMQFIVLHHAQGKLTLSNLHYIYVNNKVIAAEDIKVNDILIYKGAPVPVTKITRKQSTGIFCPHTVNGKILVNNIECSVYTHLNPLLQHILSKFIHVMFFFFPKEANNKYYNMTPVDPNSTQLLQGMHKWVYIGGNFFGVTDKAIINKQLTIEELKNE